MPTTAWRFSGTEGADETVLKLKQLEASKLVEVQDVTVIRWPQYAAEPTVQEQDEVRAALGDSGAAAQPQPPDS